ncbi:hypothetical protein F4780DRAFT_729541 [Xylariomycetidae sp. FL0641]|nr:hypothetical protein F4780DRAFT_729541 [Xylariomycetidae sp. FL0641]
MLLLLLVAMFWAKSSPNHQVNNVKPPRKFLLTVFSYHGVVLLSESSRGGRDTSDTPEALLLGNCPPCCLPRGPRVGRCTSTVIIAE